MSKLAIEDVKDANLKQKLVRKFKEKERSYLVALKSVFNKSTPGEVYRAAIGIDHSNNFISIKSDVASHLRKREV
ncbi:hypothetical protein bpSLO_001176 (plasmid) [Borrelia parkeri]|uniref:BTA121 domain-containing protein surface lipoprotein n=1 Tax=Borrelia parkeri TaxID=141 RepID=UPI001FF631A0|nr:hypothetical protein [Borrelia parkeri]UPA11323.1 hypothetical protein bpSLO_001176 [Borrelia parkeri]